MPKATTQDTMMDLKRRAAGGELRKMTPWQRLKSQISTARSMPLRERGADQGPLGIAANDALASVPLPEDVMGMAQAISMLGRAGGWGGAPDPMAAQQLAAGIPGMIESMADHPVQTMVSGFGGPATLAAYRRMTPLPARGAAHAAAGMGRPMRYVRPEDAAALRLRFRDPLRSAVNAFDEGHMEVDDDWLHVADNLRREHGVPSRDLADMFYVRQRGPSAQEFDYEPALASELQAHRQALSKEAANLDDWWRGLSMEDLADPRLKPALDRRVALRSELAAADQEYNELVARTYARHKRDAWVTEQGVGGAFMNPSGTRMLDEYRYYPGDLTGTPAQYARGSAQTAAAVGSGGLEKVFGVGSIPEQAMVQGISRLPTYRPYVMDFDLVGGADRLFEGLAPYGAMGAAGQMVPAWMRSTEPAGRR